MKMQRCPDCGAIVTGRTQGDCERRMAEHVEKEHAK